MMMPIPISDEQAKAVQRLSDFGVTVVTEGSNLARYISRVLGTAPDDAAGLVIGDPLRLVRTLIAEQIYGRVEEAFKRRGTEDTQPVSPSVAIPLLRAAYDEGRPELQDLWAGLIAAAMDPSRSGGFRLSFIEVLKQLDPLDALLLRERFRRQGDLEPNPTHYLATTLGKSLDDIEISSDNLTRLKCFIRLGNLQNVHITPYGRGLMAACTD